MPFDPTPLHKLGDRVTIQPPTRVGSVDNFIRTSPPERGGGGPIRVHVVIEIEVTDRRARPQPSGSRLGTITLALVLALLALALFGCTAHAQQLEARTATPSGPPAPLSIVSPAPPDAPSEGPAAPAPPPTPPQVQSWRTYEIGGTRYYEGQDSQGGLWTDRQGFTRYSDFYGPHGEAHHCISWQEGFVTRTKCTP